jgi:hypothetical protein
MPAAPFWRQIEKLALADRRSLGCRFGEPCDPRKLISLYDVQRILETYEDYEDHFERSIRGEFEGLTRWSGVTSPMPDGDHLIMINPDNHKARRTLTIGHEFGHVALGHKPIEFTSEGSMPETRYSDEQELEAYIYGLAVLLPYAPLLQMLEQHATVRGIAHHYKISVRAVDFRLKTAGLWEMRQ